MEIMEQDKKLKIVKKIGIIIICLALLGGTFFVGLKIGEKYYPSINLVEGLENKELGKPANVDFSLFWDAWHLIQTDYVKSAELDKQKMIYGAIQGLLGSLDDPYSVFFEPIDAEKFNEDVNGSFSGVGIEIGTRKGILTVISPMEDTPAWKAGVKAGDQIIKIDGKSTADLTTDEAVKLIRGNKGTIVILTIIHKNSDTQEEIAIVRDTIVVDAVKLSFLDNDNIAHLKLLNFNENAPYEFYQAALKMQEKQPSGMILDLRNNPGGYLEVAVDIASWFVPKNAVVVRENIKGESEEVLKASANQSFINLPVVVLINEGSASASEILAGALRDLRNIKLVGIKSYGKGSVQEVKKLFDDSMVKLTIAEWLTPNGVSINNNGLEPDYKVEMPEDLNSNADPQLDKALEILKTMI
jgi:carboxyl-terminal processing protease